MFGVVLFFWVYFGGIDKLIERLSDENERVKMKKDIVNGIEGWDNFIEFVGID